jgi:dihydroflavonol-4-reductase
VKTLVTGAAGFIGSAVVRQLLARGVEVRCYLEPGARTLNLDGLDVERVTGDINDREKVDAAMKGCDTLYHLAAIYAIWLPDPSLIYKVNVEGSRNVLWAAYKAGLKKVVFTSSLSTLGTPPHGEVGNEDTPFGSADWKKANAYIRSKVLSEREAIHFAREGLPLVVVNPGFPFGARDLGPTPTGGFIVMSLRQKVPAYVDSVFCAIDVDDLAAGHVLAAEKGRVGERYLLANHNVTYRDFYKLVGEVGGVKPPRLRIPGWSAVGMSWLQEKYATHVSHEAPMTTAKAARYAVREHPYDNSKAKRELNLPSTPLRVSIEKAVKWFRDNGYA